MGLEVNMENCTIQCRSLKTPSFCIKWMIPFATACIYLWTYFFIDKSSYVCIISTILLTPVLRQILIGYELHCCHVSDFVVIIELFPCCNCIPTLLQCLRLISGVYWSLIHVAAGHVAGDHLLHGCQIWNVGFVKVCQNFKGAITICCGCTTSVFQKSWFWKS